MTGEKGCIFSLFSDRIPVYGRTRCGLLIVMEIEMGRDLRISLLAEWLRPYAILGGIVAFIVTSILALMQLSAGNRQTKITNTLMFLNNMQTSEFQTKYFESITWLEDSVSEPLLRNNPPSGADRDISYVLNWYSNLFILYRSGVLDRSVIEAVVGVQIAQYWLLATHILKPDQLRGFDDLSHFCEELEKCEPVKTSKLYKNLKEKLQCQSQ